MAEKIRYTEYEVSFTLRLGPEKIADIPKLEKALTDILWDLETGSKISDAVEAAVGLMVVHQRGRISHMHLETLPVKIRVK